MDKEPKEFLENMSRAINNKFDNLDSRFDGLEKRFDGLSSQVKENTDMLRGLEENAKVTRAEIEKLNYNVAHFIPSILSIEGIFYAKI